MKPNGRENWTYSFLSFARLDLFFFRIAHLENYCFSTARKRRDWCPEIWGKSIELTAEIDVQEKNEKANQLHTKILTKFLLVAFCKIANLINDVAHQVL